MGRHTIHDEDVVMTMLALYEAVLDAEVRHYDRCKQAGAAGKAAPEEPDHLKWRGDYGSFEMRAAMIRLAYEVEEVWKAMGEAAQDGYTFDFEFIPDLLDHVDWTGQSPSLKGDAGTIGRLMGTKHLVKEEAERRKRAGTG